MTKPAAMTLRGRPPNPAVRLDEIIRARVTAEQRATFERIGGAVWLRTFLTATTYHLRGPQEIAS